ncbi:MAG: VCBS repeat-containing protein [Flavobacteriaceae bacterium]|nr:VCBS repeat-containing protein [Flavobacteriaceae bacterium]
MFKKLLFTLTFLGVTSVLSAQISFNDATSGLNDSTLKSGVAIGVSDMNNDGLDDVIRLSNASDLVIEFQQGDGSFVKLNVGNLGSGSEWALTIADVDENGFNDVISGGAYNNLKLALANSTGTAYAISTLSTPNIFLQNANFADINNDGDIDFFGCHDDGISSPYSGDGTGSFTYDLSLINTASTVPSDNSGNYGSIWMDYDNDGDQDLYISKCRLGVSNTGDGRRRNLLFQNDGNNNFTDVAAAAGLLPLAQSWAANFEDIDNDGDLDAFIINHDILSELYVNNGNGTFTDITAAAGLVADLTSLGLGIQVMMEDFDNDGFVDIFLTGRSGVHHLLLNNGNSTFTAATTAFPVGTVGIQSAAVGDLNNDGFIDIMAGHATGFNSPSSSNSDQLFINNTNANNWSEIIIRGVDSNINGIGARIELLGAWGLQIREVRAG